VQKTASPFNYLVGAGEQLRVNFDAEHGGGLEIDHELEFSGLAPRLPVAYPALMQYARLMRQFRPSTGHIKEVRP
jgi:hypothetical protein